MILSDCDRSQFYRKLLHFLQCMLKDCFYELLLRYCFKVLTVRALVCIAHIYAEADTGGLP